MKRAVLFSWLVLVACSGEKLAFNNTCEEDSDCPVGFDCRERLCKCRNDESCAPAGEICNAEGQCQKRNACRLNSECEPAKFCNIGTGECIDRVACGLDLHCLPGQVCEQGLQRCVDGCFDNADCPLYQICENRRCVPNKCTDKTFCEYGSRCVNNMCMRDPDPNHCRDCNPQTDDCGSPFNYCLINAGYVPGDPSTGGPNFCGVDCNDQDDCPNGYNCGAVILVPPIRCTGDLECNGGGRVCARDEGDVTGFCTCVANTDCNVGPTCLKSCGGFGVQACDVDGDCGFGGCLFTLCQFPFGQPCSANNQCQAPEQCGPYGPQGQFLCLNSGRPCTNSAECTLTCTGGGCLLGSSCAPIQGLLCPDVR